MTPFSSIFFSDADLALCFSKYKTYLLKESWSNNRYVQPAAHRSHATKDSYECGLTQNEDLLKPLIFIF